MKIKEIDRELKNNDVEINFNALYKYGTFPLERVQLNDLKPEMYYVTKDGSKVMTTNDMKLVLIKRSPLNKGNDITTFHNDAALKLLYRLLI